MTTDTVDTVTTWRDFAGQLTAAQVEGGRGGQDFDAAQLREIAAALTEAAADLDRIN